MGVQHTFGGGFGRFLDLEVDAAGLGDVGGGGTGEAAGADPGAGAGAGGAQPDPYADRFSAYDGRFDRIEGLLSQLAQGPQPGAAPAPAAEALPEFDAFDPDSVRAHMQAMLREALGPVMESFAPIQDFTAQQMEQRATELAREHLTALAEKHGPFDVGVGTMIAESLVLNRGFDDAQAFETAAKHLAGYEARIRAEAREQAIAEHRASLDGLAHETLNGQIAPGGGGGGAATRVEETPTGPDRYSSVLERWRQGRAARAPGS